MVKIVRYEVYSDRGDGWKLAEQFSGEDRQDAVFCAKDIEEAGHPVKIIREIYDTQDNSFQESIEYVGNLKTKSREKVKSVEDHIFDDLQGEYNIEATPFKVLAENQVSKAIVKLILIIVFSLVLANVIIGLSVPLVEFFVPDDKRKSVLFFGFFAVFILVAIPLLLYKIPWNVFYSIHRGEKELINERKFFRRAISLINIYTPNDDNEDVIVPVFPEAPLEYKQYIIDYLSQILNNLDVKIRMNDSFNRLGVELVVYGGCLELARYGHLLWPEANSLLYEAFKVLEGDDVDIHAFYEAKRTYSDNKIAVFLTGVGAYLMSQVIREIPMDANVLKSTMEKWISFNANPETSTELSVDEGSSVDIAETQDDKNLSQNIPFESIVGIKFNLHLFDEEKEIKESEQDNIKGELRGILSNLVQKYHGENVIEINDITSIKFLYLNKAVQFVYSFLSELNNYKENHGDYNIIIDIKNAILRIPEDKDINLDIYVSDVLEYAYNQDVVVNNAIKDELLDSSYGFEFLGDKPLGKSGMSEALYKMNM